MPAAGEIHEDEALGKAYDHRLMRRLLGYLRPYRRLVVVAFSLIFLMGAVDLLPPYLVKLSIDQYMKAMGLAGGKKRARST